MPNALKKHPNHHFWFIHRYCFQRRPLMRPNDDPMMGDVAGGVLARATLQHGVALYAYAFFSTRMFLIVGAPGHELARFNQFLFGNLARKLTPLCRPRWKSTFWQRRPQIVAIDPFHLDQHIEAARLVHPEKDTALHFHHEAQRREPRMFAWFRGAGHYHIGIATLLRLRLSAPPGSNSVFLEEQPF